MSTGLPSHDLTTSEGVQVYLSTTQFAASKVERLNGGYGNFTYRAWLKTPVQEEGGDGRLIETVVVKHAEPFSAMSRVPLNIQRQVCCTMMYFQLD